MADWPDVKVNFRAVSKGVECTMSTTYNGVSIGVSEEADTTDAAEAKARRALARKVAQRRSFR